MLKHALFLWRNENMITSTSNNKVKRLVTLGNKAKARREEKVFIVEGVKMFMEAPLKWISEVYVSESFLDKRGLDKDGKAKSDSADNLLIERLNYRGFEVVSDEVFSKISDTMTPQGILSVLKQPQYLLDNIIKESLKQDNALFIVLEDLQDPGNLGTILRAGEGAGISGVIMTKQTADIFNPKVIRSTMGSVYRVPFVIVDDIHESIRLLKESNISVYAAHLDESVDYDRADYTKPTAFLIGNEGNGLKRETADLASGYIKIPMLGQVESLNAAVATTVLMYEAARQRRKA